MDICGKQSNVTTKTITIVIQIYKSTYLLCEVHNYWIEI